MDRRRFLLTSVASAFAAPLAAGAQQPPKVPRIGYLSEARAEAEAEKSRVAAFRQGLRQLGYIEGKDIIVEQRHAAGRVERLLELAAELVRLKVDVLVVSGRIDLVKNVTGTIPIVMPNHTDPVGVGLVASLARPGGHITGLSDQHGATPGKRLQLLKEAVPSMSRVAIFWNPGTPITLPQLKGLEAAAPAQGITLLSLQVRGADDLATAFGMIRTERSEGVLLIAEPTMSRLVPRIAEFAVKNRLPTIGTTRSFAEDGLLMAYGANFDDLWHRSAAYVDKILKGANPGDLPIEQASKWNLVVNLKTAKALGLTIPPSLLLRADQVIE